MRMSEREHNDVTLYFRTVSDAHDVEIFLKPISDSAHRVCQQSPRQSMHRTKFVGLAQRVQHAVFLFKPDSTRHRYGRVCPWVPALRRLCRPSEFSRPLAAGSVCYQFETLLFPFTGCLLPDFAQQFATHTFFARCAASHYAARRGENTDTQPAYDATNFVGGNIATAARA